MQSATQALLYRTYFETWQRGERYAGQNKVKINFYDDKKVEADVLGTKKYQILLEFKGNGLSRNCTCPVRDFCKHIVAVSIIWDELRGIPKPTKGEIEAETIPPLLVSHSEIEEAYDDPVNADLEVIRTAASEFGFDSKRKFSHARLPLKPKFEENPKRPLTLEEVKRAFAEIKGWSKKSNYDLYFCAGEMVAGFCELMRIIKKRLNCTDPLICAEILLAAQKFHYELILELIDDSEGLHEFTEAHLQDIYLILQNAPLKKEERKILNEKLNEFDENRDNY